jgi:hypothetical protein
MPLSGELTDIVVVELNKMYGELEIWETDEQLIKDAERIVDSIILEYRFKKRV